MSSGKHQNGNTKSTAAEKAKRERNKKLNERDGALRNKILSFRTGKYRSDDKGILRNVKTGKSRSEEKAAA